MTQAVAVVGSGPAGLMAAQGAVEAGAQVVLFEKRPSPGRKLLIAGSSGLNITYDAPLAELVAAYRPDRMRDFIAEFPPSAWIAFIESLGVKTFKGTSRRWFVEGLKAPPLLGAWTRSLASRGVTFRYGAECAGFDSGDGGVALRFADGREDVFRAATLCLGGGSWENVLPPIADIFRSKGLAFTDFSPSNSGFKVDWPPALLSEAEGKPLKNVIVHGPRGQRAGDLVITAYGIEGTPIYAVGEVGRVDIDLKPDLPLDEVRRKLAVPRENLSPARRLKRTLRLGPAALALLYHMPLEGTPTIDALAERVKRFPLVLLARQPLAESISSAGGLAWSELDASLMLRRFPGIFVAGEMIDWDAPTGGYLIQACVSTGFAAGRAMAAFASGVKTVPKLADPE